MQKVLTFRRQPETAAVPQSNRDCGSSAVDLRLLQFGSRSETLAVPQPSRECGCSAAEQKLYLFRSRQRLWQFRSRAETVAVPQPNRDCFSSKLGETNIGNTALTIWRHRPRKKTAETAHNQAHHRRDILQM